MDISKKREPFCAQAIAAQNRAAGIGTLTEADIVLLDRMMNERTERLERTLKYRQPQFEGA